MGATEARLFACEGAKVVIGDVLDDEGAAVVREIREHGGLPVYHSLDVTSQDAWKRVIKDIEEEFTALHILVNNAGINVRYQVTDMDLKDWQRIMAVNLTGTMLGIREAAPLMKARGGSIAINIGSLAGLMGHPTTAYAASKWGGCAAFQNRLHSSWWIGGFVSI